MSERPLLALALVLASAPAAAAPTKLTLPQLVQLARERSLAARIPLADRKVRAAQRMEALLSWAPSTETTFYGTLAPAINCRAPLADDTPQVQALAAAQGLTPAQLRQRDCVATVDPANGANINFLSFSFGGVGGQFDFRFTQPIWTFGKIEYGMKAASHGMAAADAQAEAARREVELQTTQAYWGLKAARAAHDTLAEVREKIAEWEKKISDDLEAPKPKFNIYDLKRVQNALIQVDLGLGDADRQAASALFGLRLLCGDEVEVDDGELEVVEPVEHPLAWYVDALRRNRPEVHALDEGVQAMRALARLQRAYLLPDLALVGSVSARGTTAPIEESQSAYQTHVSYFGFGLLLVLRHSFDFVRLARIRHADADAEQMMAQREAAQSLFGYEVARAYYDLAEARKRVELSEKGQKIARGWLTAVDQDLEANSFTMIEAARSYFDQRINYFRAINDVNYNIARLRRASGVEVAR